MTTTNNERSKRVLQILVVFAVVHALSCVCVCLLNKKEKNNNNNNNIASFSDHQVKPIVRQPPKRNKNEQKLLDCWCVVERHKTRAKSETRERWARKQIPFMSSRSMTVTTPGFPWKSFSTSPVNVSADCANAQATKANRTNIVCDFGILQTESSPPPKKINFILHN